MNIYFYIQNFPPLGENKVKTGPHKASHGLASGLVNCGAEVTILCETNSSSEGSHTTKAGYTIKSFKSFDKPKGSAKNFKISSDLQLYIQENLDNKSLVILTGIFHPAVYSMSRILHKYGIPYIVAPHDPYNSDIFRKNAHLKFPYWYLFERKVLRQAKAVQVLDSRHGKFLEQRGIHTPFLAIPNGFSPLDVYPETSLEWQQDSQIKFFFLGRIDSHNKGLDLLIDAFAKIVATEDVHLTIQGPDYGDKKSLQAQVTKLSLGTKVSLINPDFSKSPSLLMQNYDIFCIPSRFEGFSLAALEAMLAGRVLLVSEIAGIAPHIEASGCGVVVAPEVSAIESGIRKLLHRRSEWKQMGLAGRNYALEHLQWDKIAFAALEEYKKLLS